MYNRNVYSRHSSKHTEVVVSSSKWYRWPTNHVRLLMFLTLNMSPGFISLPILPGALDLAHTGCHIAWILIKFHYTHQKTRIDTWCTPWRCFQASREEAWKTTSNTSTWKRFTNCLPKSAPSSAWQCLWASLASTNSCAGMPFTHLANT